MKSLYKIQFNNTTKHDQYNMTSAPDKTKAEPLLLHPSPPSSSSIPTSSSKTDSSSTASASSTSQASKKPRRKHYNDSDWWDNGWGDGDWGTTTRKVRGGVKHRKGGKSGVDAENGGGEEVGL